MKLFTNNDKKLSHMKWYYLMIISLFFLVWIIMLWMEWILNIFFSDQWLFVNFIWIIVMYLVPAWYWFSRILFKWNNVWYIFDKWNIYVNWKVQLFAVIILMCIFVIHVAYGIYKVNNSLYYATIPSWLFVIFMYLDHMKLLLQHK